MTNHQRPLFNYQNKKRYATILNPISWSCCGEHNSDSPPSIMFACPDRQRLPHPTHKIGWRYRISNGMHTRAQGSRAFGAPKPDNKPSLLWSLFVGPCEPPRPRSRHDGYHVGPYRGCQVAGPAAGPAAGMIRNPATGPTIAWT